MATNNIPTNQTYMDAVTGLPLYASPSSIFGITTTDTTAPYTIADFSTTTISPFDFTKDPNLVVNGKLVHNGEDIDERFKRIEKRLQMPTIDAKMEDKYEDLRKLGDQYRNLLDQLVTFEILKNDGKD